MRIAGREEGRTRRDCVTATTLRPDPMLKLTASDNEVSAALAGHGGMICRAQCVGPEGEIMSAFRRGAVIGAALAVMLTTTAYAEDPPKTPIEAPAEPNAIPL